MRAGAALQSGRHRSAAVVALLALLSGLTAEPASAQSVPPSTSTTKRPVATSTTKPPAATPPPTTAPATTAPPTPVVPPSTNTVPPEPTPVETVPTTVPLAPAGPAAPPAVDTKVEDGSEEPPPRVPVPPRTTPRVQTPVDTAVAKAVQAQLKSAQLAANDALAASQAADMLLAQLETEQRKLQRSFEALHADESAAADRLVAQRQSMRIRAVAIYVSGPGDPVIPVGDDIHEYGRRRVLVQALHAADRRTLDQYLEAKDAAGSDIDSIVDGLEDLNAKVIAARADSETKAAALQNGLRGVGTAGAVGPAAINGFAFPVGEPHNFISSFGFPRSGGRLHQGNDIFAPYGTPLFAAERGVVGKMGTDSLGGIKLWLTGESGTSYYYAHLSAFALGVNNGSVVEAGDVVGFVGNTGNAIATPPHLHFEIHPGRGAAIDPYPILKAADDATKMLAAQQPPPAVVPPAPAPPGAPVPGVAAAAAP